MFGSVEGVIYHNDIINLGTELGVSDIAKPKVEASVAGKVTLL